MHASLFFWHLCYFSFPWNVFYWNCGTSGSSLLLIHVRAIFPFYLFLHLSTFCVFFMFFGTFFPVSGIIARLTVTTRCCCDALLLSLVFVEQFVAISMRFGWAVLLFGEWKAIHFYPLSGMWAPSKAVKTVETLLTTTTAPTLQPASICCLWLSSLIRNVGQLTLVHLLLKPLTCSPFGPG